MGSTSVERVAVDRAGDNAKAQNGFELFYLQGRKAPIHSVPRPRKESKNIDFGGVLWAPSVAGDRRCPAGGICATRGADDPVKFVYTLYFYI